MVITLTLTGIPRVEDRHRAITAENFGATWDKSMAGGSHHAWNVAKTAKHSFMINGVLFHRTTASRFPIKALYGPNFAREIERHKPDVDAMMAEVSVLVHREAMELLRLALTGSRKG